MSVSVHTCLCSSTFLTFDFVIFSRSQHFLCNFTFLFASNFCFPYFVSFIYSVSCNYISFGLSKLVNFKF